MRLEMPDGTAVILVPYGEGVVVGTQGRRLPDGDLPAPSGLVVEGDDAALLASLLEVVEGVEVESILESNNSDERAPG